VDIIYVLILLYSISKHTMRDSYSYLANLITILNDTTSTTRRTRDAAKGQQ